MGGSGQASIANPTGRIQSREPEDKGTSPLKHFPKGPGQGYSALESWSEASGRDEGPRSPEGLSLGVGEHMPLFRA